MKKENVYVEVRTENQANKLKKVLDMFGEKTYSSKSIDEALEMGWVIEFDEDQGLWCNSWDQEKTKVSIKQLRNILALEHLKEGDVVVVKGSDTGVRRVGVVNDVIWNDRNEISIVSDNFSDLDKIDIKHNSLGFAGNFIRYATDEEKELLKPKEFPKDLPKQQTEEQKVIEYAKSVGWDFDKVYKFVLHKLDYSDYINLDGYLAYGKTQNILDKHKPRNNKSFTDSDVATIEKLHDLLFEEYEYPYDSDLLTKARKLAEKIKNNLELQSE